MFRGFFQIGYLIDNSTTFTVADDSRSKANLDRSQRPPLESGDKVKVTQGMFQIVAGGGVAL
jgi:hypothetical protein